MKVPDRKSFWGPIGKSQERQLPARYWQLLMLATITFLLESTFSFPKKYPQPNLKVFEYQISTSVKRFEKRVIKQDKFLLLCFSVALIFCLNYAKCLRFLTVVKRFELRGPRISWKQKIGFRENQGQNIWDKL